MTDRSGSDGLDDGEGGLEDAGALGRTLEAARRAAPALTPGRGQQWRWAVLSHVDGRRRSRRPALAIACAAAVLLAIVGWRQLGPGTPHDPIAASAAMPQPRPASDPGDPGTQVLADGSRITSDGPTTVIEKAVETADDVLYELRAGGAHFEVARRPSRTFRVHAGPVTVQVIGTRFLVERSDDRSRVAVTQGRVLVSWWGGSRELGPGEEGAFPPEQVVAPAPAAGSPSARRHAPEPGPDVLFAHADRARKAGKPELAIAQLRTVIDRFPGDPHAQAAAFTIGRLLLESLHQPRQAAASFEQARVLAKGAPLAEDALAREVDAWAAAGEPTLARRRAELYRKQYPNGSRLAAVLRVGGLEKSAP
ncbi:MAG TPA: FecR domain-containing protein [Polyangia bacterium]